MARSSGTRTPVPNQPQFENAKIQIIPAALQAGALVTRQHVGFSRLARRHMFTGRELIETLRGLDVTHVVWLPDAATGAWERDMAASGDLELVRVCREGEAWTTAAGLWLGGKSPLVIVQNTGLFESGDALRNVLFDLNLPLYALIGYRNFLTLRSNDTARRFTEPILRAWQLDYVLLDGDDPLSQFAEHFRTCRAAQCPGVSLLPEGRG